MDPVDGSSACSAEGGLPQRHQVEDVAAFTDAGQEFLMVRDDMRQKISRHMLSKVPVTDCHLPKVARHLEKILYTKFPNKDVYCDMMKGPLEAEAQLVMKTFKDQNQGNQRIPKKVSAYLTLYEIECPLQSADPPWCTIQVVMALVCECGTVPGTNEHFIATQLFVKKEQREMFLTMPTAEVRFQWLRRKYNDQYGALVQQGL